VWVGIDDTDSPKGGCTTWALTELLREIDDLDLIGYPRLVRLNPNVPFKTRGNAALSACWGHGTGKPIKVGEFKGKPLMSYPRGRRTTRAEQDALLEKVVRIVKRSAQWGQKGTDPAISISDRLLPEELYWRTVREKVTPAQAKEFLSTVPGSVSIAYGDGQGAVGATASIAWPARKHTWEIIAYRPRERWGTKRVVSGDSVRVMDSEFPETFLSWDDKTRRVLITPHTPCPILFGIRARKPDHLPGALARIESEPFDRWVIFKSNQATGDHLQEVAISEAGAGTSPVLKGRVLRPPKTLRGGHVLFELADPSGEMPCLVFEPTKTLPPVARQLKPGDQLKVWGSLSWDEKERTLRVEGMKVLRLAPSWKKLSNPVCPSCGHSTSSLGKGKGFRCKKCRVTVPSESAPSAPETRADFRGTHMPTFSARRHLAPLLGEVAD
jgi:tRNA(Ile2)-agmatinylcytidine synthase